MSATANIDTYGLQTALKNMQKIHPALRRALLKDIKKAADPLVQEINARIPSDAPLSGMEHNGRTGWNKVKAVQVKLNTRKPRRSATSPGFDQISVVRVVTKGAPLAITDMAGKAGGTKSRRDPKARRPSFSQELDSRLGPASRFVWRDIEASKKRAEEALRPIIEGVMNDAKKDFQ